MGLQTNHRLISFAIALCCILLCVPTFGAIYCYKDINGRTTFSDKPLSKKGYRLMWVKGPVNNEPKFRSSKKFDRHISEAAKSNQLDPALVKAVIHAESAFNPAAVSKKGAQGLMQLMPKTASLLHVDDPFDPRQNIMGGTLYLTQMVKRFKGDHDLALAAYNAGPTAVTKYGGIPPFKETKNYVSKVKKLWRRYKVERLN